MLSAFFSPSHVTQTATTAKKSKQPAKHTWNMKHEAKESCIWLFTSAKRLPITLPDRLCRRCFCARHSNSAGWEYFLIQINCKQTMAADHWDEVIINNARQKKTLSMHCETMNGCGCVSATRRTDGISIAKHHQWWDQIRDEQLLVYFASIRMCEFMVQLYWALWEVLMPYLSATIAG